MRLRNRRSRMQYVALLRRLWGHASLSPRRLLARLRARVTLGGLGDDDSPVDSESRRQPAAWEVSREEHAAVNAAWTAGPATELLVLLEDCGLQLTRRDLRTLRGSSWLNDEVRRDSTPRLVAAPRRLLSL